MTYLQIPSNLDTLFKWQAGLGDSGKSPVKIDLTGGDWTPPDGFVVGKLTCTSGTIITINWSDGTRLVEDIAIPALPIIPIFNVARIKQVGTNAVNIVAWPIIY